MLDLLSFHDHLAGARLVVTGEGALDEQTLHGKAPAGVARAAAAAAPDLPVVAVAGVCSLSPGQLRSAGIARAYALADIEPDLARCLEQPGPLLEELAGHIARDWLVPLSRHRTAPGAPQCIQTSKLPPASPRRASLGRGAWLSRGWDSRLPSLWPRSVPDRKA